jgi:hypothetical protein
MKRNFASRSGFVVIESVPSSCSRVQPWHMIAKMQVCQGSDSKRATRIPTMFF